MTTVPDSVAKSISQNQDCYHCGSPNPAGSENDYSVTIESLPRQMCCAGCQAVAQAIVDNGLTDFYKHRTRRSDKAEQLIPDELKIYDNAQLQRSFVRALDQDAESEVREASLILEGLVCAACVWLNEKHVMQLEGVISFHVNYSTHRATLCWDNQTILLSEILQAITSIGYHAHPYDPGKLTAIHSKEKAVALRRIAIAGIGMMQVMMLAISLYLGEVSDMTERTEHFLRWISLVLTLPVVLFASSAFFQAAWRDLKQGRLGMDVPVSLAIIAAFSASVWATVSGTGEVYFDSVNMFTFFLLVGRYLEMDARHVAGRVTEDLTRLLPETANRLDGGGAHEVVAVFDLHVNDHVLVKPGEVVPADGVIIEGLSTVNEALLTGESLPVAKQMNDSVIGGSINVESPLIVAVTSLGSDTVLSSMVRLLESAQKEKPRIARLADSIASKFVLVMLIVAGLVYTYWSMQSSSSEAFWITLSVLVVTCPCALSLATPVALTTATGALTRQGVIIAKSHVLETLAKVDRVIFDKTGTLTEGKLEVIEAVAVSPRYSIEQCNQWVAGLEAGSEHPVAKALQKLSNSAIHFQNVHAFPGRGIEGKVDGVDFYLGNFDYIDEKITNDFSDIATQVGRSAGSSKIYLARKNECIAVYSLQDRLRESAKTAVSTLKEKKVLVSLLSGDSKSSVFTTSESLGVEDFHAEMKPDDKLSYVDSRQNVDEVVLMVGDGINDAPVLAKAQVSMAMGEGTQLAQSTADMVLISANLDDIPKAIHIAQKTQTIVKQNLTWAISYNFAAIPLAAMGLLSPWMAAIGMSASSLVVVLNALRLKKN